MNAKILNKILANQIQDILKGHDLCHDQEEFIPGMVQHTQIDKVTHHVNNRKIKITPQ